jgi:cellulose synthase/poly-beta-1,6-N-acetylglucosamine synthase-like glycosyltransferase
MADAFAACLTLPGSIELLVLRLGAQIPSRRQPLSPALSPWRAAVVIPAHNEQVTIADCVRSLREADSPDADVAVDIYVIADNCIDDTAWLARQAGELVLERNNAAQRGKGYALDYAFRHLLELGCHCMLVVDADTHVASNFFAASIGALPNGEQAVQARYLVLNATETMRSRLMRVALLAFNLVRPLGRERLGLSAGILGNGFGLRREPLLALPYLATSIVEDLEYHIALVRSGRRVAFLNETSVYAEMPVNTKDVKSQRSRWEGGRFRMLATSAPSLFRDVCSGKLRCLEPLLDLLLLPLAFHVFFLFLALSAPAPILRNMGLAGILIVMLHLVAAILGLAPFYVLWKIMLIPTLVRSARSSETWVRTGRNVEHASIEQVTGKKRQSILH